MPIIDNIAPHRKSLWVITALAVVLVLIVRSRMVPPQIGTDENVFKTVDALFTSLTSRDQRRLDDCQRLLESYRQAGTLPESAAKQIAGIIKLARTEKWDDAAKKLYDLMLAQRRVK